MIPSRRLVNAIRPRPIQVAPVRFDLKQRSAAGMLRGIYSPAVPTGLGGPNPRFAIDKLMAPRAAGAPTSIAIARGSSLLNTLQTKFRWGSTSSTSAGSVPSAATTGVRDPSPAPGSPGSPGNPIGLPEEVVIGGTPIPVWALLALGGLLVFALVFKR